MASTSDFKNGLCIEFNHDLFQIVEFLHVKPGKGPAFVRTKLKSLTTGKVFDNTFNSGVKITTARIERRPFQYLYKEDDSMIFMHNKTFDQINLPEDFVPHSDLLKEGQELEIAYHDETETPLFCDLPSFIELEVTYSEPGVKGDTATNTFKPATLETGASINVPLFVNEGDTIKIDTRSREYVERVKK